MNFKNDPLIFRKKQFILGNNLNLYSCLVKKEDFYPKNKILNKIAYVGGEDLSKEIKNILTKLPIKLKREKFLGLRRLILKYYDIKPNYHNIWRINKLFKKWFKKKLFPITTLRIITFNNNEKLVELMNKIEFISSFTGSVKISLPNSLEGLKNEKLWYFVGVVFGDGYLLQTKKDYRILIADGSSKQEELEYSLEYMKKLAFLFNKIFKINKNKIKIENRGNWYVIFVSSKWLIRFFNFFFDMPFGKKKGGLSMPKILKEINNKFEVIFWRGLFDTDGMVHPKSRCVEIASSDYTLMKDCSNFLKKIEIPNVIKKGLDGKNQQPYYWVLIKSNYFQRFGRIIGSSHPRKQRALIKHLKNPLKYKIFIDINSNNLIDNKTLNLNILKSKQNIPLPKKLSKNLIRIAKGTNPLDFENARIFFRCKHTEVKVKETLKEFKKLFKTDVKYLKTRNLYYVNSRLLNKFFNKFFIYGSPWDPLSENQSNKLLSKWNSIFNKNGIL